MRPEQIRSKEQLIGLPAAEVVTYIFADKEMRGFLLRFHYAPGSPQYSEHFFIPFNRTSDINNVLEENHLPDCDIGIYSKVEKADSFSAHIPMIDFNLAVSADGIAKLKKRLAQFIRNSQFNSWVVLDSGGSYQAYCLGYMLPVEKNDEFTIAKFAEICHQYLDFDNEGMRDEITDGWWFTHSAARGGMTLRLTRNRPELKKKIPTVISLVEI